MLELVIDARPVRLGALEIGRVLPFLRRRMVGPFIFLDHAWPLDVPPGTPGGLDVLPHPHIGLATVSYLLAGELVHRDSLGVTQTIRPGEVNWMTAGRGISHSERLDPAWRASGGRLELLQAWVALPESDEEADPAFEHHGREALPAWEEPGLRARLIAGRAFGAASAVRARSPLFYVHAELDAGARVGLPAEYAERAAYVRAGRVAFGGHEYRAGQMLVFGAGAAPTLGAAEPSTVMLLGGEPVGPRHIWWNFVSSRKERIEQAKADWQAGRIVLPPHDAAEFVPLPEPPARAPESTPPPEPLS